MVQSRDPGRIARARELRRGSQDAEWKLWHELKARKLRGCKFRRQHPIGPYFVDFACVERRLIVELDGGHHADEAQTAHDEHRTRELESSGWRVLRFWNSTLDDDWSFGFVLEEIGDALDAASA